jgi:hypothetical protein
VPALLEPIVSAPLWAGSDPGLSMRLTQGLHALLMSLAAVPVYLLGRRLGISPWKCLASAALTLALPGLLFSSYLTADALGFALALLAIALAPRTLARPTRRNQLAFVVVAGLASFARLQYGVLFAAFAAAALVVAGRSAARRYRLTAVLVLAPLLLALAVGVSRLLGSYSGGLGAANLNLLAWPGWIGTDLGLLTFVAGGAIVPGAVAGLASGLGRRQRSEVRAFAAFVVALSLALLLEVAIVFAGGDYGFMERYLFVLVPPFALAFWRSAGAGRRLLLLAALSALAFAVFAVRFPLSGYTAAAGSQESPFLMGQRQIELWLRSITVPALVAALALTVIVVLGLVAVARPRGAPYVFACAILVCASYSVLGSVRAAKSMEVVRSEAPRQLRWIDGSHLGAVSLVVLPHGGGGNSSRRAQYWNFQSLFWNRSLHDVVLFPGARPFDVYPTRALRVAGDGRLLTRRGPLSQAFVLNECGDRALLSGATLVRRTREASLWKPAGVPRLSMLTEELYYDGWLGAHASSTVWPVNGRASGTYLLTLGLPIKQDKALRVRITAPGYQRTVTVRPRHETRVRIHFDQRGAWTVRLTAPRVAILNDGRPISAFAESAPRIIRDAGHQAMPAESR